MNVVPRLDVNMQATLILSSRMTIIVSTLTRHSCRTPNVALSAFCILSGHLIACGIFGNGPDDTLLPSISVDHIYSTAANLDAFGNMDMWQDHPFNLVITTWAANRATLTPLE
jgi:hypothetical protein